MEDEMSDLVKRLEGVTEDDAYAHPWTFGVICRAAANRIKALTRENENLRAQLHEGRQRQWIAAYHENDELKAEIARLREQMKDREYD